MAYKIRPLRAFDRSFEKLDKSTAIRIMKKIETLAHEPQRIGGPMGNLPEDLKGLHKVRVGDWRVFFWVDHAKQEIAPYLVDNRDQIYRLLFKK
jgi:mRNA-degrading endonuclease RelE of RelBE toxin-antitoxin system